MVSWVELPALPLCPNGNPAMFAWNASFSIGIAAVDDQHRRLLDLINELEVALKGEPDEPMLIEVANGLLQYTRYHFQSEEALMESSGYDAGVRERHHEEHQEFVTKVQQVVANWDHGIDRRVADVLHKFLEHWVVTHILRSDRAFGNFFTGNPHGAAPCAPHDLQSLHRQLELSNAERSLMIALRDSEKRFHTLIENTPALVWMAEPNGHRTYFNGRWLSCTGRSARYQTGDGWRMVLHPEDQAAYLDFYEGVIADPRPATTELRLRAADGAYLWLLEEIAPCYGDDGVCIGLIGSCLDISRRKGMEQRLAMTNEELERLIAMRTAELQQANRVLVHNEQEIHRLMLTDALTGIANRRALTDRLDLEMSRCRRHRRTLSVALADVDHFKAVNDLCGHDTGDRVLQAIAAGLRSGLRRVDLVGRYGGEEFLCILPETDAEGAHLVTDRLRMIVAGLVVPGCPQAVTASFGVAALCPMESRDMLLRRADQALYSAKRAGRNRVMVAATSTPAEESGRG